MERSTFETTLAHRLQVFSDAGLIRKVPNKWQLTQGNFEMAPYVVIPDKDDTERYQDAPFGNPILRTILILGHIGIDHFQIGSGLKASVTSICKHLNLVHHQVFPSYDLQLLQTHKSGLEIFRSYIERVECENSSWGRRKRKLAKLIIPNSDIYRKNFLEKHGWIERASKLDYEKDTDIPNYLRSEFFSFVRFMNYCTTLPETCNLRKRPNQLFKRFRVRFQS
jgi:hypothetical protein